MILSRSLRLFLLLLFAATLRAETAREPEPTTPEDQYALAEQYFQGDGVRLSARNGVSWLKKSAEQGYLPAANELAICYQQGKGVVFRNQRRAEQWFRTAAEQGYPPALINLAQFYLEEGKDRGMAKALPWFERAAAIEPDPGTLDEDTYNLYTEVKATACARLGEHFGDSKRPEDAGRSFEYYRTAADLGSFVGQLNTARCHALGLGTAADLEAANRYLENAAHNLAVRIRDLGDSYFSASTISAREAYAMEENAVREAEKLVRDMRVRIANEMADSEDLATDPASALQWFRLAAEAGSDYAAARVGMLWVRGDARDGVSEEEALALLQRAVGSEQMIAYQALGYYWSELAPTRDPARARELYEHARIEGVYAAHLALEGDHSIKPMILRESMVLARRDAPPVELSPEALSERQLHALFATGIAAWFGIGEDQNRHLAAERFQRAAARGHPEAAFYTGMAYLNGDLRKMSLMANAGEKKAFAFLEQGSANGSNDSLYMLGLFNLYGVSLPRPDLDAALRCFTALRVRGDVKRGAHWMGNILILEQFPGCLPSRAVELFTEAADLGNVDSMARLASLFAEGDSGVPRDLERARRWAEAAIAKDDDARGHYALGRCFELASPPDLASAYAEYEIAAIDDHRLALEKVARAYATGKNAPYKPLVAARYYRSLLKLGLRQYVDDLVAATFASGDEAALAQLLRDLKEANLRSEKADLFRDFQDFADARTAEDRNRIQGRILRRARDGDADAQVWIMRRASGSTKISSTLRDLASTLTATRNPDAYYYLSRGVARTDKWKIALDPDTMAREAAAAGSLAAIKAFNELRVLGAPEAPSREELKGWLQPKADKGFEDAIELLESILEEEVPADDRQDPADSSGLQEGIA